MRKITCWLLMCAVIMMLMGCEKENVHDTPSPQIEKQVEEHSPLYHEKYAVEDVIEYFNEVVLDVEYATGDGDFTLVQKWNIPLYYEMTGESTEKDREVLQDFFEELNKIKGFPGIYQATDENPANVNIGFYGYDAFYDAMGEVVNYEDSDGAVQFWYGTETNDIYTMNIGYRTDIDQHIRNSVLLEEIVNGLGITDTKLREDSIVYQEYSETQELSDMDWLLLELLYHPDIACGMNKEQCESVIRKIYY